MFAELAFSSPFKKCVFSPARRRASLVILLITNPFVIIIIIMGLSLRRFTSLVLSRRMTIVAARDLLRKPKKPESQGPERTHKPRNNILLKTPD